MSHAPPLKYRNLECSGSGFTFSSHRRASPSTIGVDLGLQPRLTQSGRISKTRNVSKRSQRWWEAQVRLYGLKCNQWTIDGMKQVLESAVRKGLRVPDNLSSIEQKLNAKYHLLDREFQKRTADDRNEKWNALTSNVAKANLDPERFLRKLGLNGGVTALHGLRDRARFHQLAEKMGLVSQSTDGIEGGYGDRILVVGKKQEDVWQKIHRIDADIQSQKRAREHTRQKDINAAHQRVLQHGNDNDIRGMWYFEIPELTEIYGSGDITWEIAPPDGSGFRWASFDLVILEGVVRINWGGKWKGKEKRFTWRGTETGEGVIQFDDSSNGGTVTFTSANECIGKFWGAYGSFEFKGKKVSTESAVSNHECEERFECFNEEAYEYARVARWK
jgi:hypothetical protein